MHQLVHAGHGNAGGHRHDGPEVARRHAVDEVAPAVATLGLDEREVGMNRAFQHVTTPVDQARLLALRQFGPKAGGREEPADAGPGGANALGQIALWHEFEFQRAGAVCPVEVPRIGLAREAADDLAHPARADQCSQPGVAVAGVVVDDREARGTLREQGVGQLVRQAGGAEAADHHGGAVRHIGECRGGAGNDLVDHGEWGGDADGGVEVVRDGAWALGSDSGPDSGPRPQCQGRISTAPYTPWRT